MYFNYNAVNNMEFEETVALNEEGVDETGITLVTKITYLIWLITCLIPNSVLIRKLSNFEFYQINFYYIIVHWCWSNILQMIYSLYITFVPQELTSDDVSVFGVIFYILTPLPAQLALFFTIDAYVYSKKFCRHNVRMGYKSLGFVVIFLSILAKHGKAHIFTLAIGLVGIESVVMLVFIIRLLIYCIKGSEEENYPMRIIMSSICIISNYLYVIYVVLNVFLEFHVQEVYFYVTMIVHMNGMINMVILHFYDPNVNIQTLINEKLENQKKKFQNFKDRFRKKDPTTETETSQYISRHEDTVL